MLPIAMVMGASIYLLYHVMPEPVHKAGPYLEGLVSILQPLLIFAMLFLTFCRIEPKDLKHHRWHWWLLLVQGGLFTALGFLALWVMKAVPGDYHDKVVLIESAMLCMICPTATAAAVVLVPLIVPMMHPMQGMDFWTAFSVIVAKIFPLLTLAITVTTKSIVHSTMSVSLLMYMALISLICCILQFAMGRFVGSRYKPRRPDASPEVEARGKAVRTVTAGQSLGQKNTVFAIWMGYSIWHNIYNSWQLYRAGRKETI